MKEEPFIAEAHYRTEWFDMLSAIVDGSGAEYRVSEDEFQRAAAEQLDGPVFGDIGPTRIIDFESLGVRWISPLTTTGPRSSPLSPRGGVPSVPG